MPDESRRLLRLAINRFRSALGSAVSDAEALFQLGNAMLELAIREEPEEKWPLLRSAVHQYKTLLLLPGVTSEWKKRVELQLGHVDLEVAMMYDSFKQSTYSCEMYKSAFEKYDSAFLSEESSQESKNQAACHCEDDAPSGNLTVMSLLQQHARILWERLYLIKHTPDWVKNTQRTAGIQYGLTAAIVQLFSFLLYHQDCIFMTLSSGLSIPCDRASRITKACFARGGMYRAASDVYTAVALSSSRRAHDHEVASSYFARAGEMCEAALALWPSVCDEDTVYFLDPNFVSRRRVQLARACTSALLSEKPAQAVVYSTSLEEKGGCSECKLGIPVRTHQATQNFHKQCFTIKHCNAATNEADSDSSHLLIANDQLFWSKAPHHRRISLLLSYDAGQIVVTSVSLKVPVNDNGAAECVAILGCAQAPSVTTMREWSHPSFEPQTSCAGGVFVPSPTALPSQEESQLTLLAVFDFSKRKVHFNDNLKVNKPPSELFKYDQDETHETLTATLPSPYRTKFVFVKISGPRNLSCDYVCATHLAFYGVQVLEDSRLAVHSGRPVDERSDATKQQDQSFLLQHPFDLFTGVISADSGRVNPEKLSIVLQLCHFSPTLRLLVQAFAKRRAACFRHLSFGHKEFRKKYLVQDIVIEELMHLVKDCVISVESLWLSSCKNISSSVMIHLAPLFSDIRLMDLSAANVDDRGTWYHGRFDIDPSIKGVATILQYCGNSIRSLNLDQRTIVRVQSEESTAGC